MRGLCYGAQGNANFIREGVSWESQNTIIFITLFENSLKILGFRDYFMENPNHLS